MRVEDQTTDQRMADPLTRADVYLAEAEAKVRAVIEALTQAALAGENIVKPADDLRQLGRGIEAGFSEGLMDL